jgi:uncharacterized membrane protein
VNKFKITGLLTFIAGVPGLGGFWLIGYLGNFPLAAKIIVINAIFFRGICGTLGGILIWRGSKWGYYLTLISWIYLVVVSFLTLNQLSSQGIVISYGFLQENYSSIGRPFLFAILKIIFGIPIIYIVFNGLKNIRKTIRSEEAGSE